MLAVSCHCGAVRLEIARAPRKLTACNCSICRRYGAIWSYHRRRSVKVLAGRNRCAAYRWRRGKREYWHCKRCGCVTHYEHAQKKEDGSDTLAVNVRNVDDPDAIAMLPVRLLDGAGSWRVLEEKARPDLVRSPYRR